ncbi:hypothetical protein SAMN05216379_1076 [Nitrosomonas eutropha]|uniref:hypothetical protein n=1 Tax=Nitrosomonas eutropha TaxID=916 RepID=UPI000891B874|nr:hypothetical protein [Nitrosomonas eutropha]SCX11272.1 hypothetical protein SAMN05216379_1076 [Nitrosomonas eutropha]
MSTKKVKKIKKKNKASRKPIVRDFAPQAEQAIAVLEALPEQTLVPYDENLLERSRTQWQFGDWESLAKLNRDTLQHHPDRAKLALLAAAGRLQTGNDNNVEARQFIRLAQDWGLGKKLISQILIAGVHNSLGRVATIARQEVRALGHFEKAITTGASSSATRLLTQARISEQLQQIGLPALGGCLEASINNMTMQIKKPPPINQGIEAISDTLKQQKAELDSQLKKQADELIRVRKFLDTVIKREVANATKQIQAFAGLQNYFATGELPNVNTERHSWPVSPDFALYLVELIERNDYDLIIEFGSGISTVIIAKVLAKMALHRQGKPGVEFISFDHLEQYYQQTRSRLEQVDLLGRVQLHHTPLQDYPAPSGKVYPYYACQATLAAVASRHSVADLRLLVVVDGPPAATGPHARYPAGPLILQHFSGAYIDILLDDYIRDDEKEIAKLWQSELEAAKQPFTISERKLEKDACLIQVAGDK